MAVKTNLKDVGWMYAAPRKRSDQAEVFAPPMSQIPLLGNAPDDELPAEPRQGLIKDTDTPYIILSKNGGRRDLLRFRENPPRDPSSQARDYPRCDWYYLEDNQLDEELQQHSQQQEQHQLAADKEPWEFRLPDYMVHQQWNPNGKSATGVCYGPGERGRPPFATEHDVPNHMVRFDKRNRLPEVRKHGYGVRAEKNGKSDGRSKGPTAQDITVKAKPHSESELKKKARSGGFQDPNEPYLHERPVMGKLLSFGYAKDWEDSHDAYERQKAEAARQQAEKLRNLQARIQAREVQQQQSPDRKFGGGAEGALKPWKATTKAGDLL